MDSESADGEGRKTYSVKIGPRRTTIKLEREFMSALRDIAFDMGVSVDELCMQVANDRSGQPGSFISALRLFVVNYYRVAAQSTTELESPDQAMLTRVVSGEYLVSRRLLNDDEATVDLRRLLMWWRARQPRRRGLPADATIDPDFVSKLGLSGLMHSVDASTSDPFGYRYRVFGRKVASVFGDVEGLRIADVPGGRGYREAAAEDYFTAMTTGAPRLQQVEVLMAKSPRRRYQRLILPFVGPSGDPDVLLVAVRYRSAGQNLGKALPVRPKDDR